MTRKPKKVEFHFDERSIVTAEEITPGEYELVGFNKEQMKILQSYRLGETQLKAKIQQLRDEVAVLKVALSKSDPIHRIYDEGIPVLVCIYCGGERGRFENEVQHTADCVWANCQKGNDQP